jgi:UDPglucose--hexose-1-phosphate uridylyltransferase
MLNYELDQKKRVVYHNDHYLAFVPYAAGAEHEVWIAPTWHKAGLQDIEGRRIDNLADSLQVVLSAFRIFLENPDFNFVIRTAPYALSEVPYYHWYIQIMPRTKILGGFERGTRIQVNTIVPEDSAQMLRECTTC